MHIFRDIEEGRFGIPEFYRRRVKRIAPAMLLVTALTLLATQALFRPEDAETAADAALWSVFSAANVFFWWNQDTNYFAAASSEKPFLHLWSLGIEEQFYLIWPLVLVLAYRAAGARWFFIGAGLVAIGSFIFGQVFFDRDPSFTYFMLPSRAGELLVGAMAALIVLKCNVQSVSPILLRVVAVASLVILAACLFLLHEDQVFPGWRTLPPTAATAMLLLVGHFEGKGPTQLLRFAPLAWVGLISYSAYLWHWPLLAFYHYDVGELNPVAGAAVIVATLLLAWATYRFVEQPARHTKRGTLQVMLRQYAVPAGAIALVALAAMKVDGYGIRWFSGQYRQRLMAIRDATRPAYSYPRVCQRQRLTESDVTDPRCILGAGAAAPVAVLWGDSNAAHYVDMVDVFARREGFSFRNLEIGSCPPLLDDPGGFVPARRLQDCRASLLVARPVVEAARVVMVSGSWSDYGARSESFLEKFFDTVHTLVGGGRLVVILGKVPGVATYDRVCREKALSVPLKTCDDIPVPAPVEILSINRRLRTFAETTPNVEYFDATNYLCPGGLCSAFNEAGEPIYYDSSHLTVTGSRALGEQILLREGVPSAFVQVANWLQSRSHVVATQSAAVR